MGSSLTPPSWSQWVLTHSACLPHFLFDLYRCPVSEVSHTAPPYTHTYAQREVATPYLLFAWCDWCRCTRQAQKESDFMSWFMLSPEFPFLLFFFYYLCPKLQHVKCQWGKNRLHFFFFQHFLTAFWGQCRSNQKETERWFLSWLSHFCWENLSFVNFPNFVRNFVGGCFLPLKLLCSANLW